jgi:hypothetical protein
VRPLRGRNDEDGAQRRRWTFYEAIKFGGGIWPKIPPQEKGGGRKGYLAIFGLGILLTVAGFLVAYQFVEPAPPRKIVIGTGDKSGAYYAFAQRYKEILARDGITLEVRSTAGSGENLKLLTNPESGVDIALVQGGIGDPASQPGLHSLASL